MSTIDFKGSGRFDPSDDPQYHVMLRGELYTAVTPALIASRSECATLCHQFNSTAPSLSQLDRANLLNRILGLPPVTADAPEEVLNNRPWIEPPFHCDYGMHITLGDNVFINFNCTILDPARVTIGSRTLMGPNVSFFTAGHPLDAQVRNGTSGPEFGKEIVVGEDCWLGGNVVILPGVKIGNGVVVGAGAVVTKDVEDHVVVAGNPARVVKRLNAPMEGGAIQSQSKEQKVAALLKRLEVAEKEMNDIKQKLGKLAQDS
ncbi:trimeric LpxA-like protein [Cyathus striatus]|nr:trimeric LpxA-like protein [Cyathus striatus]